MTQEPYNTWIEEALLFVVWKALKDASENGLPLDHHYFLTFRTDRDDVTIPDHLREKYPKEITIVLQHQFENLYVEGSAHDGHFEVDLSFDGKYERLKAPFAALVSFADPPANFGLHFTPKPAEKRKRQTIKPEKKQAPVIEHNDDKVVTVNFKKKK